MQAVYVRESWLEKFLFKISRRLCHSTYQKSFHKESALINSPAISLRMKQLNNCFASTSNRTWFPPHHHRMNDNNGSIHTEIATRDETCVQSNYEFMKLKCKFTGAYCDSDDKFIKNFRTTVWTHVRIFDGITMINYLLTLLLTLSSHSFWFEKQRGEKRGESDFHRKKMKAFLAGSVGGLSRSTSNEVN